MSDRYGSNLQDRRQQDRRQRGPLIALLAIATMLLAAAIGWAMNREYLPGIEWPEPDVVTPGDDGGPPSDAVVLFDGQDLSAWEDGDRWRVEDGQMIVGRGDLRSKQAFEDMQLHLEWMAPPGENGSGQNNGNSGVFLQDRYELQVLNSHGNKTYPDGQAGAIYKQTPPLVNATRPPGQWNVYDIIWTAPRFNDDATLDSPASITVLHNGVLILHDFELLGTTPFPDVPTYDAHGAAPIRLQDHGHPVRYRNIWVREIEPLEGQRVRKPYYRDHETGREWLVSEGETPPAE